MFLLKSYSSLVSIVLNAGVDLPFKLEFTKNALNIFRTFSSEPCEALQTQIKRYIFYQPEKGYWMVLVSFNTTHR